MSKKHETILVSVVFNVDGLEEVKCFANDDPKGLIDEMMAYLESIADAAHAMVECKWTSAIKDWSKA